MFLVTGVAGFIGFHVAQRLLNTGQQVFGIDNINSAYSPLVKYVRLDKLRGRNGFIIKEANITDDHDWHRLKDLKPEVVIHLAAQAGVRESLENPDQSVQDNVTGFVKILEFCRKAGVKHLVYASTSAVYGETTPLPWSTSANVDNPVSLYAATKKANELMAHVYSHVHGLKTTGLRFFTVYGPYGRPDMAIFKFTRALFRGEPIQLFNHGHMTRDFTYVDDIVNGILMAAFRGGDPYKVYNIGSGEQTGLRNLVVTLEELTGKQTTVEMLPMQPGDLKHSLADIEPIKKDLGYEPHTDIQTGLANFVSWYRDFRAQSGHEAY